LLRDDNGTERAVHQVDAIDSSVTLTFFDYGGAARMELGIFENEPRVALVDHEGIVRAEVNVHPDTGVPSVLLRQAGGPLAGGRGGIQMRVAETGGAVISVLGSKGQPSVALIVEGNDRPSIGLVDRDNVTRFHVSVDELPAPKGLCTRADLYDGKGEPAIRMMATGDGEAVVTLVSGDQPAVSLATSPGMKGLALRDQHGATQAELYLDEDGKLHAHWRQEEEEHEGLPDMPVS
jgi:hypothetical protein